MEETRLSPETVLARRKQLAMLYATVGLQYAEGNSYQNHFTKGLHRIPLTETDELIMAFQGQVKYTFHGFAFWPHKQSAGFTDVILAGSVALHTFCKVPNGHLMDDEMVKDYGYLKFPYYPQDVDKQLLGVLSKDITHFDSGEGYYLTAEVPYSLSFDETATTIIYRQYTEPSQLLGSFSDEGRPIYPPTKPHDDTQRDNLAEQARQYTPFV